MSIHHNEEDIDVVSSPEPSPHHSTDMPRTPHSMRHSIDRCSVSPTKTESSTSDSGKTSSAFTSFSINSILSRSADVKKDDPFASAFLTSDPASRSAHDAAMLSRSVQLTRTRSPMHRFNYSTSTGDLLLYVFTLGQLYLPSGKHIINVPSLERQTIRTINEINTHHTSDIQSKMTVMI